MKRLTKNETERYRAAFGASRVHRIETRSAQGPLGMVELGEEVCRRLASRGGRPTMPEWDIKRPIPLRTRDWKRLAARGKKLGISPAQCAALLIEKGLEALESRERRRGKKDDPIHLDQ
ncbi:MAG: hypothetical protein HY814_05815 [Candidatus Riflebacteria bacterium]|nr:hypothetical protein [Candidatus Riflebacteria bacterium]